MFRDVFDGVPRKVFTYFSFESLSKNILCDCYYDVTKNKGKVTITTYTPDERIKAIKLFIELYEKYINK